MNQKFGGGKRPTGTPSMALSSVVVVVSLLAGASVVHNIFKPDLVSRSSITAHNMFDKMSQRHYTLRSLINKIDCIEDESLIACFRTGHNQIRLSPVEAVGEAKQKQSQAE
ncbi:hypothetical protein PanWU01x14_349350 [Parasponia andersonii]|uniref:Uncharacterized protein n=1 Tax=Parasponia andersonii TaxID=3476 RepID=A0A2P5ABC3_PARAD|nr:hypothetical protein PanWU01x14_349350 [Parasponia andersonii]